MSARLERLVNLVIALREAPRPMPAEEVRRRVAGYGQDDHEAFRRMFERDKADLRALGVPIETVGVDAFDERTGYRIDPARYDLPALSLSGHELTALAVALQATGLWEEAGSGLRKLEVDAGAPGGSAAPAVPVRLPLGAPHLEALVEAQAARRRVRFAYRAVGQGSAERAVDPHALVHRGGRWYLVGHDHGRSERRAFRLDRIDGPVRVDAEPGAFPPAPGADVDDVVPRRHRGAVATVAASPDIAWHVARHARAPGSDADTHRPGWRVHEVAVDDAERFVTWVLGYGPEVEVLEPAWLRARVVAALERVAGAGGAGAGP